MYAVICSALCIGASKTELSAKEYQTKVENFSEKAIKAVFFYCHLSEINVTECGWKMERDKILALWDEEEAFTIGKGCGRKVQKCDG